MADPGVGAGAAAGYERTDLLELRRIIHEHLKARDVYASIHDFLGDYLEHHHALSEGDVLGELEKHGVVEDIIAQLSATTVPKAGLVGGSDPAGEGTSSRDVAAASTTTTTRLGETANLGATLGADLAAGRQFLHVRIIGGKAFLDHLAYDGLAAADLPTLTLHLHWRDQRFATTPVTSSCDPVFGDSFLIDVTALHGSSDPAMLLTTRAPIHMVLTKRDAGCDVEVVGTHALEWRQALELGAVSATVEMSGIGASSKVPVGLVDVKVEVLPRPMAGAAGVAAAGGLTREDIEAQLRMEATREAESTQLFYVYAKQWWKDYLQLRAAHRDRLIKIFALTEYGHFVVVVGCCCWLLMLLLLLFLLDCLCVLPEFAFGHPAILPPTYPMLSPTPFCLRSPPSRACLSGTASTGRSAPLCARCWRGVSWRAPGRRRGLCRFSGTRGRRRWAARAPTSGTRPTPSFARVPATPRSTPTCFARSFLALGSTPTSASGPTPRAPTCG